MVLLVSKVEKYMEKEEAVRSDCFFFLRLLVYASGNYPRPREDPDRSSERPRTALLLRSELRLVDTLGRDVEREDTEVLRLEVLRCVWEDEGLTFSRDDRDDTVCTRAAGWLRSRA